MHNAWKNDTMRESVSYVWNVCVSRAMHESWEPWQCTMVRLTFVNWMLGKVGRKLGLFIRNVGFHVKSFHNLMSCPTLSRSRENVWWLLNTFSVLLSEQSLLLNWLMITHLDNIALLYWLTFNVCMYFIGWHNWLTFNVCMYFIGWHMNH